MTKPQGLQHHFVVIVHDNGKVEMDYEILLNRDGSDVYEPSTGLWYHHCEDDVSDAYDEAHELIASIVEMHNNPRL